MAATVWRPVSKEGKRNRAIQPFPAEDRALLEAISDGKYARRVPQSRPGVAIVPGQAARGRLASKVSYRLQILRAHGLIRKSPGQRRYHRTTKGRHIVTALLQVQHATAQQLNALAA
jgi:hypothetical protein